MPVGSRSLEDRVLQPEAFHDRGGAQVEKPADAADEPVKPNETKEKNDKKEPAADGEGASCGKATEEAKQEERGEVVGGSPEGNAEAQGNGGDTQSDNLTAPEKPAQQSRRGRKKKR